MSQKGNFLFKRAKNCELSVSHLKEGRKALTLSLMTIVYC